MYYYGARYLDPKYSRWISTDPALGEYMRDSSAGEGGAYNTVNLNLYHYSGNNPVTYIDPDGRVFNVIVAVAGAVIGASVGAATTALAGGSGKDIAAAALGGAAGGALAGFTCGASLAVTVAVGGAAVIGGATVAAGTDIAINAVQGNELLDGVGKASLGGGVGGVVGYVAGVAIGTTTQTATSAKEVAPASNTTKSNNVFPENPDNFNPNGLTKRDFKNGEIKKWINKDNKAIYEWNKDPKYGDHYHFTPDGKNRVPGVTGDTHLKPGEIVPEN